MDVNNRKTQQHFTVTSQNVPLHLQQSVSKWFCSEWFCDFLPMVKTYCEYVNICENRWKYWLKSLLCVQDYISLITVWGRNSSVRNHKHCLSLNSFFLLWKIYVKPINSNHKFCFLKKRKLYQQCATFSLEIVHHATETAYANYFSKC